MGRLWSASQPIYYRSVLALPGISPEITTYIVDQTVVITKGRVCRENMILCEFLIGAGGGGGISPM